MNPFTDHPHEVGETYWTHLWFALGWSRKLALLSLISFLHALFPFLFEDTVSTRLIRLYEEALKRAPAFDPNQIQKR